MSKEELKAKAREITKKVIECIHRYCNYYASVYDEEPIDYYARFRQMMKYQGYDIYDFALFFREHDDDDPDFLKEIRDCMITDDDIETLRKMPDWMIRDCTLDISLALGAILWLYSDP